jgi:exodeoxyribonuclease-1
MAATFFWHDYETWGRVPRRDRPAQFAGIRTDLELNEVADPVELYCRPPADTLPDPESVLVTRLLPQQAAARGVSETEFAAAVERELATPCTIGVGYNSIRFDDEVTRFLFWRNLIDPYAREWRDECGRWDLLDVVRCCWALRPEGIEWPRHDDGRPSFRLEHLTAANGLAHESAHDAVSDVRATIALARLLRERKPRLWDFCLRLRTKEAVRDEIGAGRPFVHLSGRYPLERGCLAIVWPLAPHPVNRNELIVWDLAHDPSELARLDAATARRRLYSRADELPEGETRLPIKTIRLNRAPIVVGNLDVLTPAARARWAIDVDGALANARRAEAAAAGLEALWAEVYARAPAAPADIDEDLYGAFASDDDRRRLERLRALPPERLADRVPTFDDARLEELVFRWRARNFEGTLSDDERARWREHVRSRLVEGTGGATTLQAYFDRIDALADEADERTQALLEALYEHGEALAAQFD